MNRTGSTNAVQKIGKTSNRSCGPRGRRLRRDTLWIDSMSKNVPRGTQRQMTPTQSSKMFHVEHALFRSGMSSRTQSPSLKEIVPSQELTLTATCFDVPRGTFRRRPTETLFESPARWVGTYRASCRCDCRRKATQASRPSRQSVRMFHVEHSSPDALGCC